MADVFISYSRKDSEFVQRLHAALDARGRDVWVDWEDIPPSWDWRNELRAGIESAATIVFVISPDSLASDICGQELEQAVERGKRLVPILRREPDGGPVPEVLADRNWIFLRDEDDFDTGLEKLEHALGSDEQWVRDHTRLLVRATEWERGGRSDNSLLLRGGDLANAEATLGAWREGTEPVPTPLQQEYVAAGRRAAGRRTRTLLAAAAIALIVSIVLGVLALVQRERAIDRERAAQSRALAVEALLRADSDPELSVLLGIEAARLGRTDEADEALRRAVSQLQARGALRVSRGTVGEVAVASPDRVLAAADDGSVKLWDASARRSRDVGPGGKTVVVAELTPDGRRMVIGDDSEVKITDLDGNDVVTIDTPGLGGAALTDDGRRLVGLVGGTRLERWDIRTGRRIGAPVGLGDRQIADGSADAGAKRRMTAAYANGDVVAWDVRTGKRLSTHRIPFIGGVEHTLSPDGSFVVAVGAKTDHVDVWDTDSGRTIHRLNGHERPAISVAVSFDGKLIATGGLDNNARIWSAESGRALRVLKGHGDTVNRVAFSRDGRRLLTVSNDESARVWSIETGEVLATVRGHRGPLSTAALSADGRYLATGGTDGTARLWEASPGRTLAALAHDGPIEAAALDPQAEFVASSGPDRIQFARADTGEIVSRERAGILTDGPTADLSFDPRRRWLGIADGGVVFIFSTEDGNFSHSPLQGTVNAIAWNRPGNQLLAASEDGVVRTYEPERPKPVGKPLAHGTPVVDAQFMPGDRRALTLTRSGTASIWDLQSGKQLERRATRAEAAALALSPDGRVVAIANSDGNARLWRPGSPGEPRRLAHVGYVTAVRFSRDGRLVATASGDGTARVWDVRTGRNVHTLRRHTAPVNAVDFTPDGNFLISAGDDRQALVWDLRTGRVASVFGGYDGRVLHAAFSHDGTKVLTVPERGAAAVFACDPCGPIDDVIERARRLVGRELTEAERRRFLPGTP